MPSSSPDQLSTVADTAFRSPQGPEGHLDPRVMPIALALFALLARQGIFSEQAPASSTDEASSASLVVPASPVALPLLAMGCGSSETALERSNREAATQRHESPSPAPHAEGEPTSPSPEKESSGCQEMGQGGLAGFTFLGALGAAIARIFPGDSKAERLVSGAIAVPSTLLGACSMMASGVTPELFLATLAAAGVSAWAIFGKGNPTK